MVENQNSPFFCFVPNAYRCALITWGFLKPHGVFNRQRVVTDATTVFVLRDTGFQGSANLVDVVLDGVTIANLGQGETVTYPIEPGEHILSANFRGIGGVGLNSPVATFEVEGKEKRFFTIQLRTGALINTMTLTEVSRDSYFSIISQR